MTSKLRRSKHEKWAVNIHEANAYRDNQSLYPYFVVARLSQCFPPFPRPSSVLTLSPGLALSARILPLASFERFNDVLRLDVALPDRPDKVHPTLARTRCEDRPDATIPAFITDGNHLTNLMTIGANTTTDGQPTTGINIHGHFEGDASLTRGDDAYLGNNFNFKHSASTTLSYATPSLHLRPRFLGGIAETGFFLAMFVNNQTADNTMPLRIKDARSFFDFHRFPDGFYRRQGPYEFPLVKNVTYTLIDMIGRQPGNNNGVNNYVVDPEDSATVHRCLT
ncbi:hypothetical protein EV363DRAFT_1461227 [Boletus edulis]|nr:hypothetical protein EV363DRAFT_1461227 [Boletus edulis]